MINRDYETEIEKETQECKKIEFCVVKWFFKERKHEDLGKQQYSVKRIPSINNDDYRRIIRHQQFDDFLNPYICLRD
ncbi:hypothetical protein Glove_31g40 [Diversispora epigaea]|uniref:Uncharacterized protein n=1 Tax=Diversispora epigaea TaxID=1348612 RepID=A0A397JK90_9GLOM|nr:hypothetical protein Glove_31g40 [Diversispora epigaea]